MSISSSASRDLPEHAGDAACFAYTVPTVPSRPFTLLEWRPLSWKVDILAATPMVLVHRERVVDDGRTTSLDTVDVWVDGKTRGVRVAARATLPLRQIATAPGGVRIFAARDERAGGQHLVQFVVTHPKDALAVPFLNTMAAQGAGPLTWVGACGHHRVAVPVTREGDTATLQLATMLPDLAPGERSAATPLPPTPAGVPSKDVRVRHIRAQFSVSQTSRDAEPVVAVSMAWAGPEAFHRLSAHVPPPVVRPQPQPRPASKPAKPMVSTSR